MKHSSIIKKNTDSNVEKIIKKQLHTDIVDIENSINNASDRGKYKCIVTIYRTSIKQIRTLLEKNEYYILDECKLYNSNSDYKEFLYQITIGWD